MRSAVGSCGAGKINDCTDLKRTQGIISQYTAFFNPAQYKNTLYMYKPEKVF